MDGNRRLRAGFSVFVLLLAVAGGGDSAAVGPVFSAAPPVVLWAWERPEDLRFLDAGRFGVAYLAGTLALAGDEVVFRPRLQPLRVAEGTWLIAVVRIEPSGESPPAYSAAQRAETVRRIGELVDGSSVRSVQADFDALRSERFFYRDLLWQLREALPKSVPISMTALASWCLGDRWLDGLPVEEAVPMLFDMGADREQIAAHLAAGGDFRSPVCRKSLGLATYDHPARLPADRRLYLFHSRPWTPGALERVLEEVRR